MTPWTELKNGLPQEGKEVIWRDIEGSYHLGKLVDGCVEPAVYGNAPKACRALDQHVAWMDIGTCDISIKDRLPKQGEDVIWQDVEGGYHLGCLKGKVVMPAVYGNDDDVLRPLAQHTHWRRISAS